MICSRTVKKPLCQVAAVALAWCLAAPAQAATQNLSLTGVVANGNSFSQVSGPTQFDSFILSLDGLTTFSLANLDQVAASITLDQALTVPASVDLTSLALGLQGSGFSGGGTETANAFFSFSLAGGPPNAVVAAGTGATTSNQVVGAITIAPPFNQAFSFDALTVSFQITALDGPVTIDSAYFRYTLLSPAVPEPASYGLMLLGLGAVAGLVRRRNRGGAH